jgi:hypothetical protein
LCTDQGKSRLGWMTTRARTWAEWTRTRVRPWSARQRSPNPHALALAFGQVRRAPSPSAVLARTYKASLGAPHLTLCSPSPARRPSLARRPLFCPPLPPEPRPPWPAHSIYFQVAPAAQLASPIACEAFLALGPGRTSPENQDHPHRTLAARLRT